MKLKKDLIFLFLFGNVIEKPKSNIYPELFQIGITT